MRLHRDYSQLCSIKFKLEKPKQDKMQLFHIASHINGRIWHRLLPRASISHSFSKAEHFSGPVAAFPGNTPRSHSDLRRFHFHRSRRRRNSNPCSFHRLGSPRFPHTSSHSPDNRHRIPSLHHTDFLTLQLRQRRELSRSELTHSPILEPNDVGFGIGLANAPARNHIRSESDLRSSLELGNSEPSTIRKDITQAIERENLKTKTGKRDGEREREEEGESVNENCN